MLTAFVATAIFRAGIIIVAREIDEWGTRPFGADISDRTGVAVITKG